MHKDAKREKKCICSNNFVSQAHLSHFLCSIERRLKFTALITIQSFVFDIAHGLGELCGHFYTMGYNQQSIWIFGRYRKRGLIIIGTRVSAHMRKILVNLKCRLNTIL